MIDSVTVAKVATFGADPQSLDDLRRFNYIFGSNGTGKTTIGRVIANTVSSPDCRVAWKDGRQLEPLVLNRDFVDKNFSQLRGVFTLGKEQKATEEKIKAAKQEYDEQQKTLTNLKRTLEGEDGTGGKKGELAQLEADYREKFWVPVERLKRDGKLVTAMQGVLNNKEACKSKILAESQGNTAALKPLNDLVERAATVFGEAPTKEALIASLNATALVAHEANPILKKKVIGKEDVDIAEMIRRLGNSDWVRQGLPFLEANDGACPFCQQDTTEAFAKSLREYFDEAFEQDTNAIGTLVSQYATDASSIQQAIDDIIAAPGRIMKVELLTGAKATLDQTIAANYLLLRNKKKEPSQVIELESLRPIIAKVQRLIHASRLEVRRHNTMVDNLAAERKTLTAEVWRLVLDELKVDLRQYNEKCKALNKAIVGINENIGKTNDRINKKTQEIRDLEKQTTSIQPTINGINGILSRFGFDSFKLAVGPDKKSYRLIRHNGDDARETLSEGEKTFVVFLYFYYLLKGSMSESGITTDRIVVFDDPVSSLDSDILFIVSSVIREVCEDVRQGRGHIRQVFVFTHNVYFHKEVTFNEKRKSGHLNEESFWIVRKLSAQSAIERHEVNPIKSTYELLWLDVRCPHPANTRIENTLRRILEHYFTILGAVAPDQICAEFDGQDKLICRSLFSWVNAGSHHAHDEIFVTQSDAMIENCLRVFRQIFEKTNHAGHYKMMMGDAFVDSDGPASVTPTSEARALGDSAASSTAVGA